MAEINLPKEMLQKEAFKSLSAKEKEEYLNNIIQKILEINPDGLTLSQMREATGLTHSTIWHHLEILNKMALCRKISRGNIDIYNPAGKISPFKEFLHTKSKARYMISTLENDEGSFVCIYDKRQNRTGSYTFIRGIAIPFDLIDEIIETLTKVKKSEKK